MPKISPQVLFGDKPEIGAHIVLQDVTFTIKRSTPHTRLDGEETRLLTWAFKCPKCGKTEEKVTGLKTAQLNAMCEACWKTTPKGRMTASERRRAAAQDWGARMAAYRQERLDVKAGKVALRCTAVKADEVEFIPEADVLKGEARFNDGHPHSFEFSPIDGVRAYGARKVEIAALISVHLDRLAELYREKGGKTPVFV